MDTIEKLKILSEDSQYDLACACGTFSGAMRTVLDALPHPRLISFEANYFDEILMRDSPDNQHHGYLSDTVGFRS